MVGRIVAAALRFPAVVFLFAAALSAAGVYAVATAPLDVFPEFAPPIVEIQAEAAGYATSDVEALVAQPIELALAGIPNVEVVRSTSSDGLATIHAQFPYGTDPFQARQLVTERLAFAASVLPDDVRPAVAPFASALSTFYAIGLTGDDPFLTRDLAQWTLRPRLLAVPGVADVVIYGGAIRQVQVTTTPERLEAAKLTLSDLVATIRGADGAAGSGFIDASGQRLPGWLDGGLHSGADLRTAALVRPGATTPLPLSAVADIRDGAAQPVGDALVNGAPGVLLLVTKQPGVNVPTVTLGVEDALASLSRAIAPSVTVHAPLFRSASFIEHAVSNLSHALIIGAVLVLIVLLLFLGHARSALISVVAIPLSLFGAIGVLYAAGQSINVMVLGGLAIAVGEVVDDAIIDVENAWRRMQTAAPGYSVRDVVLSASLEVRSAVVYATLMVALVFLPVAFLGGLEGALFRPLAFAYILATATSLLIALTVTPVLAARLLPTLAARRAQPPRLVAALRRRYAAVLEPLLGRPVLVLVGAAVVLCLGLALLPTLHLEFLPEFHETNFVMHQTGAPGLGLDESARLGMVAEKRILAIPGVRSVAQQIGRSALSEDAWGAERSELLVQLDPGATVDTVTTRIHDAVADLDGVTYDLKQFLNERIEELLEGTGAELVVKLRGADLQLLAAAAEAMSAQLREVSGVTDVYAAGSLSGPVVQIRPRRADLLRLGASMDSLSQVVRSALGGLPVTRIADGSRLLDVVVRLDAGTSADAARLGRLPIALADGRVVTLSMVADVEIAPVPSTVNREDGVRTVIVRLDAQGRNLGAVAQDVSAVVKGTSLPAGIYAEVGGEYVAAQTASRRLLVLSSFALVGIFALLVIDFESPRLAALTMVNVPLAFTGGIVAVLIGANGRLSLGAIVGFVTVFGITLRNGIVLLAHYRHEEREQGRALDAKGIVSASMDRLSPILMTAFVTGIALLPLVVLGNRAGGEIEGPLALVVVGGLITSTALNLLVVPVLYARAGARRTAGGST